MNVKPYSSIRSISFARSQDIVLHSRVLDYKPEYLYQVAYEEREFFDYGGWLAMYPMSNLPYYRVHMERRKHHKRVEDFVLSNPELFEQVRTRVASSAVRLGTGISKAMPLAGIIAGARIQPWRCSICGCAAN